MVVGYHHFRKPPSLFPPKNHSLTQAVILGSVLSKASIPVMHVGTRRDVMMIDAMKGASNVRKNIAGFVTFFLECVCFF